MIREINIKFQLAIWYKLYIFLSLNDTKLLKDKLQNSIKDDILQKCKNGMYSSKIENVFFIHYFNIAFF